MALFGQAHTKLLREKPPSWLGLVAVRLDERTLPLSQRVENFRSVTSFTFFNRLRVGWLVRSHEERRCLFEGTDPEEYITECTLVHEDKHPP